MLKNLCRYIICDWACKNRACVYMILAYFLKFSSLTIFSTIMLWKCSFQLLVSMHVVGFVMQVIKWKYSAPVLRYDL